MRVIWSVRAIKRLNDIKDYIAIDSPQTAQKVVERIISTVERLADFPLSGRMVPEFENRHICEVIVRPYRVLYLYSEDIVEIVTVLHSKQIL